jgi:VWA domain-containing protein
VDFSQEDAYVIEFAQQNTHLDRDILIDIELTQNRSNTILAVEKSAVMASFTPNEQDCQRAMNTSDITNEFIFVVDCSGSMADENKIGFARQAMLLFLKSLPVNCHFNIIRFGSNYESLFKDDITAIYNKENAQQAEQLTNNMQANLGGTELVSFRFFNFIHVRFFFNSYLHFDGLNSIQQKKVALDKSFF